MRIGLITRRFDPNGGGTERDLLMTARILDAAGHSLTIYAAEVRAPSSEFSVCCVSTPPLGRALRLVAFSAKAADTARRDGADIVLSFARVANADILRSGGGAHSSYVHAARQWQGRAGHIAVRVSPYHLAQIAVERRSYTSPCLKRAIAVSDLVRRDLIRTFTLDPTAVTTLYNGVDLERFRPEEGTRTRLAIRHELGIPDRAPTAMFVGNGFARKGLRFLIEAWPMLDLDAYLIVAGADRRSAAYVRLAARHGMRERIRFAGPRSDIERLFLAADALALPSLFEPFGNVVMEAMAAGLPVLCTTACGASEVIPLEMREFIVTNPTDVGEIAARLKALLKVRSDLSAFARTTAEQFTWERYGKELLALIAGL
jgi:UDP-glucose:(heptosyl)LPS alpha-1,3-glucosyltransferase